MLNCKKKSLALFLILILTIVLILPCAGISAAGVPRFVALGDSTGFGLSAFPVPANRDLATLHGFNDQFADSLGILDTDHYANLAWPGDTTGDLLADLQKTAFTTQVSQANILTVMIGGNNLLGPSIAAICGLWGISPDDYENDLDGRAMLQDLAAAVAYRYATIPGYNPADDFARLMDLSDPVALAFHAALLKGTLVFAREWPKIASRIRLLNRLAELYVCTVHNPLQISDPTDPLYPLYVEFETLLGAINRTIRAYALIYRYRVVDLNRVCKSTPGATTFDIAGALTSASIMYALTPAHPAYAAYELLFLQQTDPHPSYIGHVAAYNLLRSVRSGTPYWYWYWR